MRNTQDIETRVVSFHFILFNVEQQNMKIDKSYDVNGAN